MEHLFFKPCSCRVCIGSYSPTEENRLRFLCRVKDVQSNHITLVSQWLRYDFKTPANRGSLLSLPLAYTELTDIYDTLYYEDMKRKRDKEESEKIIANLIKENKK